MKAIKCKLIMNNSWGYCYTPQTFESISAAKKTAREMIDNGYAFSYRIIKHPKL